jgi:hypothetical protein
MYPHLEPHGLILKINRQPLPQLPADTLAQDREYWRKVVASMLGDWLDEKTTVAEVAAFVDRVYGQRNLTGFNGDPRFVQCDYAQKTFSKLRSSIAGVYAWRLGGGDRGATTEYQPQSKAERQALLAEADLGFRQAFALCPTSPEAVFRYVQLLLQSGRLADALLVARTSSKLDPDNGQIKGLVQNLKSYRPHLLVVSIDASGVVRLGPEAKPVSIEQLREELLAAAAKTPDVRLTISADKNATYALVVKVMDAAKEAKISGVQLEAEKP